MLVWPASFRSLTPHSGSFAPWVTRPTAEGYYQIGKGRRLSTVMVTGVACGVFDVGADGRPDAVGVT